MPQTMAKWVACRRCRWYDCERAADPYPGKVCWQSCLIEYMSLAIGLQFFRQGASVPAGALHTDAIC